VGLEQPIGVEVPVRLEQRAPENGREHRRDDELRKVPERRLPKFSALHPSVDQSLQRLQSARDDVLEVELRQLRMFVTFANQEACDHGAPRLHQLLDEGEERAFDEFLSWKRRGFDLTADRIEGRRDDALHYRLEQLDLGLEVEVGKAFAHLRPGGDILKPRACVAVLREFLEGCGDDLLRARVPALHPLGCFSALGGLGLGHGVASACAPSDHCGRPAHPCAYANIMTDWSVPQGLSSTPRCWTRRGSD